MGEEEDMFGSVALCLPQSNPTSNQRDGILKIKEGGRGQVNIIVKQPKFSAPLPTFDDE